MEIINPESYVQNGYMQGMCPACKGWEAPITPNELSVMEEEYAHHGSGEKSVDETATYRRVVWDEYFQCPRCKERYAVRFSDT